MYPVGLSSLRSLPQEEDLSNNSLLQETPGPGAYGGGGTVRQKGGKGHTGSTNDRVTEVGTWA